MLSRSRGGDDEEAEREPGATFFDRLSSTMQTIGRERGQRRLVVEEAVDGSPR